jgi:hypothetical protein
VCARAHELTEYYRCQNGNWLPNRNRTIIMNAIYVVAGCACLVCCVAIVALVVGSIALNEVNHIKAVETPAPTSAPTPSLAFGAPRPIVQQGAAFPLNNANNRDQAVGSLRSALLKNAANGKKITEAKRSVPVEADDSVPNSVRLQNKKPVARALTLRERLRDNANKKKI